MRDVAADRIFQEPVETLLLKIRSNTRSDRRLKLLPILRVLKLVDDGSWQLMDRGFKSMMEAGVMSWDGATSPSVDGCVILEVVSVMKRESCLGARTRGSGKH